MGFGKCGRYELSTSNQMSFLEQNFKILNWKCTYKGSRGYPAVTYATSQHQGRLFWIVCKRPAFLSSFSCLKLIQNSAPSGWDAAVWHSNRGDQKVQKKVQNIVSGHPAQTMVSNGTVQLSGTKVNIAENPIAVRGHSRTTWINFYLMLFHYIRLFSGPCVGPRMQ